MMQKQLILALLFTRIILVTQAREIAVCSSCECTTIKSALEEANSGDTLMIRSGVYREGNIVIDKSVALLGNGEVIIDGAKKDEILTVRANNVTLRNLQIQNTGSSFSKDMAAIKLERVKNCTVENCKVLAGYFGIYLSYAQNCFIRGNDVFGVAVSEFTSGNAIHLWYCKNIVIEGNTLTKHRDGIYLEFSDSCRIEKNHAEANIRYGLHFMFSDNDIYKGNIFKNNQAGVAVMYSHHITMLDNEFSYNWGATSYGLLLKEIKDGDIAGNTFLQNTVGIFAESTDRMNIRNNVFDNNGWALKIAGSCMDNVFAGNNFLSNSFELGTDARSNSNRYEKNYWSKYSGYDLDRDGIGDVPHNPVDLFTYLVEQQPSSIILMRSLFIDLLILSEKVNPMLTPTALRDEQPLMQAVINNQISKIK